MDAFFLKKKRKNSSPTLPFCISENRNKRRLYYSVASKNINNDYDIIKIEKKIWNKRYSYSNKKKLSEKIFNINKKYIIRENTKYYDNNNLNILNINIMKIHENNTNQNEKEYIYHCLKMQKYNIKQIIGLNHMRNINYKKFNLILDLDLTMINAVDLNNTKCKRKNTDIEISGIANKKKFQFWFRYRPYLFSFVKELKDYFNFFISTLGHKNYARKIIEDFEKKADIKIPDQRLCCRKDETMNTKKFKYINELIPLSNKNESNNTIIIDDNIIFWLKPESADKNKSDTIQCIKCLIPSKRYILDIPQGNEDSKFEILIKNNIIENGFIKNNKYSLEVDYSLCIEKDSSVNKCGQLYYIELFIKKCIQFSLFSGIPIVEAMNFYRKKIFENCIFNLKFLDNEWHYLMNSIIRDLGGTISISIDETTHFIIEKTINSKNILYNNNSQKYVNVNYIIQCYFNLHKLDEDDKKYKAINKNNSS